jgi:hypothetical protein
MISWRRKYLRRCFSSRCPANLHGFVTVWLSSSRLLFTSESQSRSDLQVRARCAIIRRKDAGSGEKVSGQ